MHEHLGMNIWEGEWRNELTIRIRDRCENSPDLELVYRRINSMESILTSPAHSLVNDSPHDKEFTLKHWSVSGL